MPNITLPDGSEKQFDAVTRGADIAASIGKSLARDAVAVRVDGEIWDLNRDIENDAAVEIVTRASDDGLELLRHDAAHALAEAVKELWPETQVTIGPAIENGFYYDFSREEPFTENDLEVIEARMKEIVDRDEAIEREVWNRDEAVEYFRGIGEEYKAEIIASIPTAPPGRTTRSCASTCTCSRKPRNATIAGSAVSWTCSTSRKRRRGPCSGIPMAGPCFKT
jgi:threonyl-tRNA synthetase